MTRGKFRQVTASDGGPVSVRLYACTIDKAPYARHGKTYVCLDVSRAVGDLDLLHKVDAFVESQAHPDFSPVSGTRVIAKMPAGVTYETEDGDPGPRLSLTETDVVDVELVPGAFGKFGYCWLVRRVKPHVTK